MSNSDADINITTYTELYNHFKKYIRSLSWVVNTYTGVMLLIFYPVACVCRRWMAYFG